MPADGRSRGRSATAFRVAMRDIWAAQNAPCGICGQATIDYQAERFSPDALELDHIEPVTFRPDLEFVTANVRPTHTRCNRTRGAGHDRPAIGITSETW